MNAPGPGAAFLHGLAQRLELTGLVHVRTTPGETTPILAPEPGQLERLERAGRDWLAGRDVTTGQLQFIPVRTEGGAPAGVVVAEHDAAEWTSRDGAVLAFCIQAQREFLETDPTAAPTIVEELRTAVEHGELRLLYQPEYDLSTRRVVAAEALIRWHHPQRGDLEPGDFIQEAERSGLIRPIGEWIIRTAVSTLAYWRQARPQLDLGLRINISPVQMTGTDVCDQLESALLEHDVPGSQISIELTEHEPPQDLHEVAAILRRLKSLGVTSAIDDLATGYSTLSRLRNLPVDMIKIDRSLVTGIDTDQRAQSIVTAMIGLALNFDLGVVAEGVQNENEVATLLALGCTRAQGHYLSVPLTADGVLELVDNEHTVLSK